MDTDVPEARNRTLNRAVAVTVVVLSVATALSNIKDGNIVQTMQADTAAKIDYWSEYQADRLKLHLAGMNQDKEAGAAEARHYDAEGKAVKAQALAAEADYGRTGYRDDQFDLGEGFASIAIAATAVAALIESWGLLSVGWVSGAFALLFMVAGFVGLPIHPEVLIGWLT